MTHLLVVRAHPLDSEHSRSMQVTDAFVKSYTLMNYQKPSSKKSLYLMDTQTAFYMLIKLLSQTLYGT